MRFGDYEVLPSNQWCYQIYRVLEPVTASGEQRKAKYRKAEDGSLLEPIECYPTTLAEACRKVAELSERDAASSGDAREVEKRLTALYGKISAVAASCRGPVEANRKEAAR